MRTNTPSSVWRSTEVAINFSQMLGSLRMGVDVLTITDADDVPHTTQPGYNPVYTLRDAHGKVISEGPVDFLTEYAHNFDAPVYLYEDTYPVFSVISE